MVRLAATRFRIYRGAFFWAAVFGLVLLLSVAIYYLTFRSGFFVIKRINCVVEADVSPADKERWCSAAEKLLVGKRIFSYRGSDVVSALGNSFLPVASVSLTNEYPHSVNVVIGRRSAIAKVSSPHGIFYLLDNEGVVFSRAVVESLPTITLDLGTELYLGQQLDTDLVSLIMLDEPQVSYIQSKDNILVVRTVDNLEIFFAGNKSLREQIRSLQLVLKEYKMKGKSLKRLDLRFERPVVAY